MIGIIRMMMRVIVVVTTTSAAGVAAGGELQRKNKVSFTLKKIRFMQKSATVP